MRLANRQTDTNSQRFSKFANVDETCPVFSPENNIIYPSVPVSVVSVIWKRMYKSGKVCLSYN